MGNKSGKATGTQAKVEAKKEPEMTPETYNFQKVDKKDRIIGVEIEEVLKRQNVTEKPIVPIIQLLLDYTEARIETPKIWKEEGGKTQTNVLTYHVDKGELKTMDQLKEHDIHVAVTVLKKYVREIPGGLMDCKVFATFGDLNDKTELWAKLKEEIPKNMKKPEEYLLYQLARLLNLAMKNKDKNEMELAYLTQAFRMNLMESPLETQAAMKFTSQAKNICDAVIEGFDEVFDPSRY